MNRKRTSYTFCTEERLLRLRAPALFWFWYDRVKNLSYSACEWSETVIQESKKKKRREGEGKRGAKEYSSLPISDGVT